MSFYENIHLLKKNKKRRVPFCFMVSRAAFLEFYDRCTVFVTGIRRANLGGKEALFETFLRDMFGSFPSQRACLKLHTLSTTRDLCYYLPESHFH